MSYRAPLPRRRSVAGLGQAKWVPGQLSFAALPPGVTAPPNFQRLQEAGLPIAPYIEHGSWVTGEPDIMRYGLDPYRGIMGLGMLPPGNIAGLRRRLRRAHAAPRGLSDSGDGLGCALLDRLLGRAPAPASLVPSVPSGGVLAPAVGANLGTGTVTCGGQVVASNAPYGTAVSMAYVTARRTGQPCTLQISGGTLGTRTVTVGPSGPGGTIGVSGLGMAITESQMATILLMALGAGAGLTGDIVRNKWLAMGLGAGLGFITGKIIEPPSLPRAS